MGDIEPADTSAKKLKRRSLSVYLTILIIAALWFLWRYWRD
jgi:hypothetical protein